jgi:hypothetical protein
MVDEKTSPPADLHEETSRIWDQKADFWDGCSQVDRLAHSMLER